MEKPLNLTVMLSLKEIALRRVIVVLWSEPDILDSIAKFRCKSVLERESIRIITEYQEEWCKNSEHKVIDKISQLMCPEMLKEKMLPKVKPIGLQIMKWKKFHEKYLTKSREEFDVPILEKLCWTSAGVIDYQRTAEELIRRNMLDVEKRYKLACLYCIEEYIPSLWKELPQEIKRKFYHEKDIGHLDQPLLHLCWPYILKGEESKLDYLPGRPFGPVTYHRYAFEYAVLNGNKTAAEYFFLKLSKKQRENYLTQAPIVVVSNRNNDVFSYPYDFPKEKFSEVLCFLLSQMNREQQMHYLKKEACRHFRCFLDWPCQDLFFDIAAICWDQLTACSVVFDLMLSIKNTGYYSKKIFRGVFKLSLPTDFKIYFALEIYSNGCFLPVCFDYHDTKTLKIVFRHLNDTERFKIVFSDRIMPLFYNFIAKDEWHMVKVCLQEAMLSSEGYEMWKEAFMEFLRKRKKEQIEEGTQKVKRFFEFLDEKGGRAPSKKRLEDETATKKLCCRN